MEFVKKVFKVQSTKIMAAFLLFHFLHNFAQFVKWHYFKIVHYIALVIIQSIGIQDSEKYSPRNTARHTPDS